MFLLVGIFIADFYTCKIGLHSVKKWIQGSIQRRTLCSLNEKEYTLSNFKKRDVYIPTNYAIVSQDVRSSKYKEHLKYGVFDPCY